MMAASLLQTRAFHETLLRIDRELAARMREEDCLECGGRLHASNYPRKPRGGLPGSTGSIDVDHEPRLRFSFCCGEEGCRKRHTPRSVRFLPRRLYTVAAIVLITALLHGLTGRRAAKLRSLFDVGWRTVERWRVWWQETFAGSPAYLVMRARLRRPRPEEVIPRALLLQFGGGLRVRMLRVLCFLERCISHTGSQSGSARAFAGPQSSSM